MSLRLSAPHGIRDSLGDGLTREIWLINHAYAAGADAELEACGREIQSVYGGGGRLRAARRPKPPSLKEQALEELNKWREVIGVPQLDIIRKALETIND